MFTRIMASKVMVRLSEKLNFLPLSHFLPDGFINDKNDAFFACILEVLNFPNFGTHPKSLFFSIFFVSSVKSTEREYVSFSLQEISMHIEEDDKEVFIIFDSFTVFCGFTNTVSHIPAFIRDLQQFNKATEIKLAGYILLMLS